MQEETSLYTGCSISRIFTPVGPALRENFASSFWKFPLACNKYASKSRGNLQHATSRGGKWSATDGKLRVNRSKWCRAAILKVLCATTQFQKWLILWEPWCLPVRSIFYFICILIRLFKFHSKIFRICRDPLWIILRPTYVLRPML